MLPQHPMEPRRACALGADHQKIWTLVSCHLDPCSLKLDADLVDHRRDELVPHIAGDERLQVPVDLIEVDVALLHLLAGVLSRQSC